VLREKPITPTFLRGSGRQALFARYVFRSYSHSISQSTNLVLLRSRMGHTKMHTIGEARISNLTIKCCSLSSASEPKHEHIQPQNICMYIYSAIKYSESSRTCPAPPQARADSPNKFNQQRTPLLHLHALTNSYHHHQAACHFERRSR